MIIHETDSEKNVRVQISGTARDGDYFMDGLPANFKASLDSKYELTFIEKYPEVAIRIVIREAKEMIEGFRPQSEI